ncbi:MAG: T9SS type A sorting domain-containing protein, partial [Saprospiraceae bacterium]|nr:T9SS type A sorting domain-containing protein [Saprospiraceae bacterium]
GILVSGGLMQSGVVDYNNVSAKDRGIQVFFQSALGGPKIRWNNITMSGNNAAKGISTGGSDMFPMNLGTVEQNTVTMNNGHAAIQVGTSFKLSTQSNTVNLVGGQFGIYTEGGSNNAFNCNNITGPGQNSTGIYAMHAGQGVFSCNKTEKTNTGLHFEGIQMGKAQANVSGNTMKDNATGLLLGVDAIIGQQEHRGNLWKGGVTQALHLSPDVAPFSLFTVDALENPSFIPVSFDPQGWFVNLPTPGNSFLCGASCNVAQQNTNLVTDKKVANGELGGLQFGNANNWLAKRRLYERISEEGNPYGNDVDINNFIQAAQNNGLSQYANLQINQRGLFAPSPSEMTAYQQQEQNLYDLLDDLTLLEQQQAAYGLSAADSSLLAQQRLDVLEDIAQSSAALTTLAAKWQQERSNTSANLLTQNNQLSGSANYQQYEKTVNGIWLQTIAQGVLEFNAAQTSTLQTIANACPLSDGEAVLRARTMLALVQNTPLVYDDQTNCSFGRPGERTFASGTPLNVLVYPNPTEGKINILFDAENSSANLTITNALGQLVYQMRLLQKDETVDLHRLANGIYTYTIIGDNGSVKSGQITIQK